MFGLIGLVLVWLLIIRPLGDALDRAKQRHNTAVLQLAEARARSNPGGARPGTAASLPLDALISRTAADAGFTAARVTGGGPTTAQLVLDAARPQALFGWIASLESQGVRVDRLQARANPDRTVAVEAAFSARASQ
jgi:general secretion pathway protein M